ncbi:hypothetical protein vBValMR10Z_382 [Vibrio phage vB_ValM_R10Z]|nr:hypothetical protein vBValMR10Z_382 [Vibrio phage vB_ValM_R10Z]
MTRIKWTLERLKEDALKYKTRKDWRQMSCSAYSAAQKKGLIDECCSHMTYIQRPNGYWTLERLKEDALKYTTKADWQANSSGYLIACRRDVLDECCEHMQLRKRPHGFWTLERLKADALKYTTKSEWQKKSGSAYSTAQTKGFIDECCSHMQFVAKSSGFWTLERLKEDALKYKTRSEWQKKSSSAYSSAQKKGLIDECCSHMKTPTQTALKRCIYRIYAGNEVYIGLTYDVKKRFREHKRVTKQIIALIARHGADNVKFERITDYMEQELAQIAEKEHIEQYRNDGWVILNRCKAGSLGGSRIKWTLERLKADALKYKTRKEWNKKSTGAYSAAYKRGVLDECCAHMLDTRKPNGYWTLERLKEDALKYKTRKEWNKKSRKAYDAARSRSLIDECCGHMPKRAKRK